ncbi:ATP-binding cassette domain-containing protein [Plantactinospora endophytica]|uniref:Daunorubicin resistance protein DrrA family ABC transporter ATP-binding protein n=1 Tax=Plantactinospora endophytica TaxID=673535 RepID=A0ABQ4EDF4_9ACTN|nr:ATP-binding cassette domain-containing protein [Plantactinospora endophytica]GIG92296.1 daunorubicin resistance protein DrrA family ABC transporter ATP-binding protein [Plantactinospora endophytica]
MNAAVQVDDLTKRFGGTPALRGVNLAVAPGEILGLLGPNGAGKTTLVRILSTLDTADSGTARVYGYDLVRDAHQVRALIGLTGQFAAVDKDLSGLDNLEIIGRLLGLSRRDAKVRAAALLERFDLVEAGRKVAGGYSGGMRRRLDLAASLVGRPTVLYLDEPTTGLDPHSRAALWDTVRQMAYDGTTVLLTTQYMDEAEALADRLVLLDGGRITAEGTTAELCARVRGRTMRIRPVDPADLPTVAATLVAAGLTGGTVVADAGQYQVPVNSDEQVTAVVWAIAACGVALAGIDTGTPSLDEAFLRLTQSEASLVAAGSEVSR